MTVNSKLTNTTEINKFNISILYGYYSIIIGGFDGVILII